MMRFMVTYLLFYLEIQESFFHVLVSDWDVDLCGNEDEVVLSSHGKASAKIINLGGQIKQECKLHVKAPDTHVVYLQFIEDNVEIHRAMNVRRPSSSAYHPSCVLSIYLPGKHQAVWREDVCSLENVPRVDLLTPNLTIVWEYTQEAKGRKILLTAVGKGDICNEASQFTCMKIGWKPEFCISDELVCNGRQNCPNGSKTSDEDEEMCIGFARSKKSWKKIAVNLLKKFKGTETLEDNNWLLQYMQELEQESSSEVPDIAEITKNWKSWRDITKTELTTQPNTKEDAYTPLEWVFRPHGPWGYLSLGLIVCAFLIFLCALWECCLRRYKNNRNNNTSPPTTVLILNNFEEGQALQPPDYEDLDLPPSYTALFPNKLQEDEGNITETIQLNSISSQRDLNGESSTVQETVR